MKPYIELMMANMTIVSVAPIHIVSVTKTGTGSVVNTGNLNIQVRESYDEVLTKWKEALDDKDDHRDDQTSARTRVGNKR